MNPLKRLNGLRQSVWLDFLSREFLQRGGLARLVSDDGLTGVTSNPSIFEKAIGGSDQYDLDIKQAAASGDLSVMAIYESLAIADIRAAADVLRPVYDRTRGADGFVSLEVSPYLAMDTEGTLAEARRLWRVVERENLMIKVPGTEAGLPAIRTLIGEGININITLLFSQKVYEDVIEAYLAGLEKLAGDDRALDRVASVASFFVSRIDTLADKELDYRIAGAKSESERAELAALHGKVAVANAKLAYRRYQQCFSGPRWQKLEKRGARPQRLLWASTGTKNPEYSDVLYIEGLIGPDTINTMPQKTMDAFRDHGKVAPTLLADIEQSAEILRKLEKAGVSLDKVTADLVVDGVKQFSDAFDQLLGAVAAKRRTVLGERLNSQALSLGAASKSFDEEAEAWRVGGKIRKLWRRDSSLWTRQGENEWLGWLDIVDRELGDLDDFKHFAGDLRSEGFKDVLLLGMGGSSLAPEVLAETLKSRAGFPKLHVLDSTDPQQVRSFESKVNLADTLFVVSSKSGATLEPTIFMEYFLARTAEVVGIAVASRQFVAITDPGSALEKTAKERGFRKIFAGIPSIGGRYAVLSKFGLVPLAAIGYDVESFLKATRTMVRSCSGDVPPAENAGLRLGLAMGVLGRQGRDKVTIVASPSAADFGAWAEQLIAESTGKGGRGLIPVDAEPLGDPSVYGDDRLFVYVRDAKRPDAGQDRAIEALAQAGHPLVRIGVADTEQLGQEFFRWEIATAVAGAVLGINPFDQPDVEASKVATRQLTDAFERQRSLPPEQPVFRENGITLFTDENNAKALKQGGARSTLDSWLRAHFARLNAGDYFAALAYVERNEEHVRSLQELRAEIRDRKHVATCVGFGPRYLHSTGQAYKGGPNTGVFLQITANEGQDLPIPGRAATFGVVKAAQARGDFQVLAERGRRVLLIDLAHDVNGGLATLNEAARRALR